MHSEKLTSLSTHSDDLPKDLHVNLHSHSAFSDGKFTPEALVLQSIKRGVSVLGISDHYNTRKTLSISPDMLVKYINELDRLSDVYGDKIKILKAIEINTLELFLLNMDLPPTELLERLDYVLLEYVTNIPRAGIPLRHTILIARDIPVQCGLAHTDLSMAFPDLEPEALISRLIDADIFLELNESYRRPGERHPFYQHYAPYFSIPDAKNLKVSVGTDSHMQIPGPAMAALKFLSRFNLVNNLFCLDY